MAKALIGLEEVSTGYKVFERDQVLTEDQLNKLADYLDDQQRLTRVALVGVGIFGGLQVEVADGEIRLSKGVGVTTDGDLIRVPRDLVYTRFRRYDETAPDYEPLADSGVMRKIYELAGETVTTAKKLSSFRIDSQKKLSEMTAVLLMESYVKDGDLCTGGDCDNKGKDAISNVKLLLVDRAAADALARLHSMIGATTPDAAARGLAPVVADRVQLGETITTRETLFAAHTAACLNTRRRLREAFQTLLPKAGSIVADLLPGDPASRWADRIDALAPSGAGVQQYYGFLKDVTDTWNTLVDVLYGDTTVSCPPLEAFPKHLVLGDLVDSGRASSASRTGTYPSPVVGVDARAHARFLVRKIDILIAAFTLDGNTSVQVVPSLGEDHPLESRAIPGYYGVDASAPLPIHRAWSYLLERRGLSTQNYGARAAAYSAVGAAASPLSAQIGRFSFFRVEGHIGQPVKAVVDRLTAAIRASNLPFTVRAVHVGTDRKVVIKPPIRYSDLHRLHYLLRQDVSTQLDDVITHSAKLRTQIDQAVDTKEIGGTTVPDVTKFKNDTAAQQDAAAVSAHSAQAKLNSGFQGFRQAAAWQPDIKSVMANATGIKLQVAAVTATDVATPLDTLVTNNHLLWVDWLDQIITTKDDQDDDKLLFSNFIKEHPAAEHFGGVSRGGTFVLLHQADGAVIGDVALPYWWPEPLAPAAPEPTLPRPDIKPPILIDPGFRIIPPLDDVIKRRITERLDDFEIKKLDPIRQQAVDVPRLYLQSFRDSTELFTKVVQSPAAGGRVSIGPVVKDPGLDLRVRDLQTKADVVDDLRNRSIDPNLDAVTKAAVQERLVVAEKELVTSITETTKFTASTPAIDQATDGVTAMTTVSNAMSKLSATTAAGLETPLKNAAGTGPTKVMVENVLRVRGITR